MSPAYNGPDVRLRMPRQPDRCEQFRTDRRAKRISRLNTRQPKVQLHRALDRPADPFAVVEAHARHFAEPTGPPGQTQPTLRPELKVLRHLAHVCWERSRLLDTFEAAKYADALVALSAHWRDWLRPLDAWEPPDGDTAAQFGTLARHVLASFDVPRFLDAAWHSGTTSEGVRQQNWFKLVGSGRNIREAVNLPLTLTRWMAHHFITTPPEFDIPAAFRRAWVLGLGGTEELARSLLATRLGSELPADDFWESVVRWLVAHPELAAYHHGPVIDFLHDQRFVPSVPVPLSRGARRLVPPKPNLCMTGRRPDAMLRAVADWHRWLATARRPFASWAPSTFLPLTLAIPATEITGTNIYAITELICTTELAEEGAAMGHCVATYANLCRTGQSSVWSLTAEDANGHVERLLTVQVSNWQRLIVQARGKCNRVAYPEEAAVLAKWTQAGGPALSAALAM